MLPRQTKRTRVGLPDRELGSVIEAATRLAKVNRGRIQPILLNYSLSRCPNEGHPTPTAVAGGAVCTNLSHLLR